MEETKKKPERFYNVDFLRFVLAVIIVMYHGIGKEFMQVSNFYPALKHGYFCVEFFFIIAGFFLFKNIKKDEDTINFVKKRYIRLATPVLIALLLVAIISIFIPEIHFNFNENILKIFLLQTCGLSYFAGGLAGSGNWFVSVLFCTSIFYFYLYKITDKKIFNFITALLVLFSYVIFLNFKGNNHWGLYKDMINVGILRGIGGLGFGYFLAMLYQNEFLKNCTNRIKIILTGLEIYLLGFLVYYLLLCGKTPGKSNFLFILTFGILFYLFLIREGYISKLFNNKTLGLLGKYSYTIYIIQFIVMTVLKYTLYLNNLEYVKAHASVVFCFQTIVVIISGILVYYFIEQPITKFLNKKFLSSKKQPVQK